MTTGRINQVTTFLKPCPAITRKQRHSSVLTTTRTAEAFGAGSFVNMKLYRIDHNDWQRFPLRYWAKNQKPTAETPYPPISHNSNALPPVGLATRMAALRENYQQPAKVNEDDSTVAADSQVDNCNRFSYQQVIHIGLHHCRHRKVSD
jgi:hypothetical protein